MCCELNYSFPRNGLSSLVGQNREIKNDILLVYADEKAGSDLARSIIYEIVDVETVLFLSGGRTPIRLYSQMAEDYRLKIGAAGMVDERYGKPMHRYSNELTFVRSGLTDFFKNKKITFYPILNDDQSLEITARNYDQKVNYLLDQFSKSVAVLGIGEDGHIAGIAPDRADFTNPLFSPGRSELLVSYFADPLPLAVDETSISPHGFGERITMTFKGLAKIDVLIVLTFGENKRAALSSLFTEGPISQVPARFLKSGPVANKTIIIADQNPE
jgi:6-phosphogluconolactonase/glucosamine-6-phosphate isomerase/deaminase